MGAIFTTRKSNLDDSFPSQLVTNTVAKPETLIPCGKGNYRELTLPDAASPTACGYRTSS